MCLGLCQCSSSRSAGAQVVVSVKEQKLAVYDGAGSRSRRYPVSTSRYGANDRPGTYGTPLGMHEVVAKIGQGARLGAVFKNRRPTGEVIKPGTPGRDPIVSRILWLRGLERQNRNAYARCIYIHGTADEADVGRPVSYGCIRMKSRDVVDLFNLLPIGSRVFITQGGLPASVAAAGAPSAAPPSDQQPPLLLNPEGGASGTRHAKLAENSSRPRGGSGARPDPADRSTIIYSAPGSGGPGVTLRSKRKSAQMASN